MHNLALRVTRLPLAWRPRLSSLSRYNPSPDWESTCKPRLLPRTARIDVVTDRTRTWRPSFPIGQSRVALADGNRSRRPDAIRTWLPPASRVRRRRVSGLLLLGKEFQSWPPDRGAPNSRRCTRSAMCRHGRESSPARWPARGFKKNAAWWVVRLDGLHLRCVVSRGLCRLHSSSIGGAPCSSAPCSSIDIGGGLSGWLPHAYQLVVTPQEELSVGHDG